MYYCKEADTWSGRREMARIILHTALPWTVLVVICWWLTLICWLVATLVVSSWQPAPSLSFCWYWTDAEYSSASFCWFLNHSSYSRLLSASMSSVLAGMKNGRYSYGTVWHLASQSYPFCLFASGDAGVSFVYVYIHVYIYGFCGLWRTGFSFTPQYIQYIDAFLQVVHWSNRTQPPPTFGLLKTFPFRRK